MQEMMISIRNLISHTLRNPILSTWTSYENEPGIKKISLNGNKIVSVGIKENGVTVFDIEQKSPKEIKSKLEIIKQDLISFGIL